MMNYYRPYLLVIKTYVKTINKESSRNSGTMTQDIFRDIALTFPYSEPEANTYRLN